MAHADITVLLLLEAVYVTRTLDVPARSAPKLPITETLNVPPPPESTIADDMPLLKCVHLIQANPLFALSIQFGYLHLLHILP